MTTALITGASSGIGLELARLFVRADYQVVMVARDTPRLHKAHEELATVASAPVVALPVDLAEPGAAAALAQLLDERQIEVDGLVNNAGFGVFGPFAATDPTEEQALLQVNLVALTELTKALLPGMVARHQGRILNVASTAAFLPGPLMAVYYASKAYVLSFSEALSCELEGTGVTVTTLCPGPTASAFQDRAGMEGRRLFSGLVMSSDAVARAGYAGMMRGERVVVPGWQNELVRLGARFAPTGLLLRIVRYAQQHRSGFQPPLETEL